MHADHFGLGPGMAAPEAAGSLRHHGFALVAASAVAHARLNAEMESALPGEAGQTHEQDGHPKPASGGGPDKAFLTLQALLALKGHVLDRIHGDDGEVQFIVTRLGLARELPDIPAVCAFAEQVGAAHA